LFIYNITYKLIYDIYEEHNALDLFYKQNCIYFGELTLYHGSGTEVFKPESFELELGSYIKLPPVK